MKTEYKIMATAIVFGLLFWLIDLSANPVYQKIFVMLLFIVFGILLSIISVKRRKALRALRHSHERFRTVANFTYDWEYWMNPNGHFVYISPSCERITGYKAKEFFKDPELFNKIIHPEDKDIFLRHYKDQKFDPIEFRIITRSGEERWIGHVCQPVFSRKDGQYLGRRGNNRDITDKKLAEVRIRAALEEKEILLREIYHRVKNNMQVISSILKLQARHIQDEETLRMFRDTQNRVKSMSLVHEKLYQSKDLSNINFSDYTRSLISLLFSSYNVNPRTISVKFDMDRIVLNIKTAIPIGLIISEIVSNSLKYAFPEGRVGEIIFKLRKVDAENFSLIISDNGVGIPEDIDFEKSDSLGMHLIKALTTQIHGSVSLDRNNGTTYTIRFKNVKDKKRF